MANSGSFTWTASNNSGIQAKINWNLESQSIANNTSQVAVTFELCRTDDYTTYRKWDGSLICGTNSVAGTTGQIAISKSSKPLVQSYTFTVKHDDDGTCSVKIYASGRLWDYNAGTYYIEEPNDSEHPDLCVVELPLIARKSSISVSGEFTMGSSGTITIEKASPSLTHTIIYTWGDTSGTICTRTTADSVSWTPPLEFANKTTTGTVGYGELRCDTYSGYTLIGSSSIGFVANVPSSIKPSVTSFTAERIDNDVPASWELYIQGKSQCKLKAVASGSYGSTITSYVIRCGSTIVGSSDEVTSAILNSSGNVTFTVYVTDSRGRTDSKTVTINVVNYSAPSVISILSQRCLQDGTLDDDGTYIKTSCNTFVYAIYGKNIPRTTLYYRKSGESSWISCGYYTPSNPVIIAGTADVDSSYEVMYQIQDSLSTVQKIDVVSTGFTTMDFRLGGHGVSIGKVSEQDNLFDVGMNAMFRGSVSVNDGIRVMGFIEKTIPAGKSAIITSPSNDADHVRCIITTQSEVLNRCCLFMYTRTTNYCFYPVNKGFDIQYEFDTNGAKLKNNSSGDTVLRAWGNAVELTKLSITLE